MNKLLLVDGNSLFYRAYFGSAFGPAGILTNKDGQAVNAVSTFFYMMKNAIDRYSPTHMLIAFDKGSKTKRHEKLKSYKEGRAKTPDELISQMPIVREMINVLGLKYYEEELIEADDIVGSLAKKYSKEMEVFVMSSDKDLLQLCEDNISIILPQNRSEEDLVIYKNEFFDRYMYHPNQVPDIKGIMGDSSDNLPGVKGIGAKGAVKLISDYKTLENIYENIEEIKGATKQKLIDSKEIALLCKEIATIDIDIDVPFSLKDMSFDFKPTQEWINFFEKYGLFRIKSFVSKLVPKPEAYNNIIL